MSMFFEDTMQGLLQAVEISRGVLPVTAVEGMPAKTYRVIQKASEEKMVYFDPAGNTECEDDDSRVSM